MPTRIAFPYEHNPHYDNPTLQQETRLALSPRKFYINYTHAFLFPEGHQLIGIS